LKPLHRNLSKREDNEKKSLEKEGEKKIGKGCRNNKEAQAAELGTMRLAPNVNASLQHSCGASGTAMHGMAWHGSTTMQHTNTPTRAVSFHQNPMPYSIKICSEQRR
jgi:hypothetical protein